MLAVLLVCGTPLKVLALSLASIWIVCYLARWILFAWSAFPVSYGDLLELLVAWSRNWKLLPSGAGPRPSACGGLSLLTVAAHEQGCTVTPRPKLYKLFFHIHYRAVTWIILHQTWVLRDVLKVKMAWRWKKIQETYQANSHLRDLQYTWKALRNLRVTSFLDFVQCNVSQT